ncbi:Hypothetical predicted protein [Podarcis lilfordi]|uniref:Uncharacterized protein n=1 Tax=Podarcis lilfordi TaxID=74358 RepID=A0AA35PK82_9SAUR|nr:Hypothetical predicted protein [Podarcis lilfordi]
MRGSLQARERLPSSGAAAPDEFEFDTPVLWLLTCGPLNGDVTDFIRAKTLVCPN